ncbi:hypothetical protein BDV11DRAFT_201671 [Aspergillus similis]
MVDREKHVADKSSEATPLLQKTATIISARNYWQHQQLLRCFLNLKQIVSKTTGLFKTEHVHEFKYLDPIARQSAVEERRWSIYVSRAIHRFSVWWTHLPAVDTPGPGSDPSSEKLDRMPPLDILMVFHALTLYTKACWEDCFQHQKMAVWNEGFPLQLASQCIDPGNLTYSCPESCRLHFENLTKLAWDNLDDSENLSIECFRCLKQTAVLWTTRRGKGLADNGFLQLCQWCKFILRRDALLVQKLRRDLQLLLEENIPLPGPTNELVRQLPVKLLLEEVRPTNLFPNMTQIIEASAKAVGSQSLPMLHDIFGHYQYMGNSSCDLYAAVMRVSRLTPIMQNMDWADSEVYLQTESRYVNFLQGYSKWLLSRRHNLLNTDSMDPLLLFWSTHLLVPRSYCDLFRRFGKGELVNWEPPHDSATCNLCHTLCPASFARRLLRGFTSLSEWKEWLSIV